MWWRRDLVADVFRFVDDFVEADVGVVGCVAGSNLLASTSTLSSLFQKKKGYIPSRQTQPIILLHLAL